MNNNFTSIVILSLCQCGVVAGTGMVWRWPQDPWTTQLNYGTQTSMYYKFGHVEGDKLIP